MPDSIKAIPSNNPSRFFNPEDKALRGFMGCFLTLNLFPCFPLFSAPVVAAFAFRCITPSVCILVVTSFSSLFSSVPRRGCPALFLHFPSIPLLSISGCGRFVLFSPVFFIYRALRSFLDFSSYFPRRLLLPSLFDALPLHIGCLALFLHFLSIPLPSVPGCGCSVFFSSFFFIFRILRSFPAFSPHFPRRSFLRFFLVPGRK